MTDAGEPVVFGPREENEEERIVRLEAERTEQSANQITAERHAYKLAVKSTLRFREETRNRHEAQGIRLSANEQLQRESHRFVDQLAAILFLTQDKPTTSFFPGAHETYAHVWTAMFFIHHPIADARERYVEKVFRVLIAGFPSSRAILLREVGVDRVELRGAAETQLEHTLAALDFETTRALLQLSSDPAYPASAGLEEAKTMLRAYTRKAFHAEFDAIKYHRFNIENGLVAQLNKDVVRHGISLFIRQPRSD